MEEEIEVVAFACRGTLLDWTGAIEAVAYELARCNGESPLDRGAALRRRVESLAGGHGLARGFERLARASVVVMGGSAMMAMRAIPSAAARYFSIRTGDSESTSPILSNP